MKLKNAVFVACVLIAVSLTLKVKATTWMDAFAEIKILNEGETEPIGDITASFGETLSMRIELNESIYHEFFKNGLNTEIITTTVAKSADPTITQKSNVLDQTHLQEFNVRIPLNFEREAVVSGTKKCISFIVRTTFNASRQGYEVEAEYKKERKVNVCKAVTATPSPTPLLTPTPTSTTLPPSIIDVSPTPTAEIITDVPVASIAPTPVASAPSVGDGVVAFNSTAIGKSLQGIVMAIPIVGAIPVIISIFNMASAIFITDRRRPEHWVKVIDAVTGKPVGGAVINVLTPDGKVRATWISENKTGNTGDILEPGQYAFVAQKPGYIFPSTEEPIFPMQSGEFIYRSGLINLDASNTNSNA